MREVHLILHQRDRRRDGDISQVASAGNCSERLAPVGIRATTSRPASVSAICC
jgi:hypothetical protein